MVLEDFSAMRSVATMEAGKAVTAPMVTLTGGASTDRAYPKGALAVIDMSRRQASPIDRVLANHKRHRRAIEDSGVRQTDQDAVGEELSRT
ncbi:MAG: hypothetical protein QM760_17925 [Nibricoccus sp.]